MNNILIKIFLYAKDPYEAKYQFSIDKRKITDLNLFKSNVNKISSRGFKSDV